MKSRCSFVQYVGLAFVSLYSCLVEDPLELCTVKYLSKDIRVAETRMVYQGIFVRFVLHNCFNWQSQHIF